MIELYSYFARRNQSRCTTRLETRVHQTRLDFLGVGLELQQLQCSNEHDPCVPLEELAEYDVRLARY